MFVRFSSKKLTIAALDVRSEISKPRKTTKVLRTLAGSMVNKYPGETGTLTFLSIRERKERQKDGQVNYGVGFG